MWSDLKKSFIYIVPAEKVERLCCDTIPFPLWLGKLIQYFIDNIRIILKPLDGILSIWVNTRSRPLGECVLL